VFTSILWMENIYLFCTVKTVPKATYKQCMELSISRCSHIGVQRIYFWTYDSIMFGMSYTISIPKFIMHLNWCFHYLRKDTNLSYAGFRGATEFSWPTKSDWYAPCTWLFCWQLLISSVLLQLTYAVNSTCILNCST